MRIDGKLLQPDWMAPERPDQTIMVMENKFDIRDGNWQTFQNFSMKFPFPRKEIPDIFEFFQ
jgi:hypothetical protein